MEYVLLIFGTLMALNFGFAKNMSNGIYENPANVGEVEIEALDEVPTPGNEF